MSSGYCVTYSSPCIGIQSVSLIHVCGYLGKIRNLYFKIVKTIWFKMSIHPVPVSTRNTKRQIYFFLQIIHVHVLCILTYSSIVGSVPLRVISTFTCTGTNESTVFDWYCSGWSK